MGGSGKCDEHRGSKDVELLRTMTRGLIEGSLRASEATSMSPKPLRTGHNPT